MNRLTKGKALFGAIRGTDINVSDDLYINGAVGANVEAATVADGGSMAITAAQLLNGIVSATPTQARTISAPTAAALVAAVDADTKTGLGFEFTVINLAASTHALTLGTATGTTIVGSATIAAASSATFVARIASSTAVVIYRK